MVAITPVAVSGYVVHAGFLGKQPIFADGSGGVVRGTTAERAEVHGGAILAATATLDGKALITSGDDGKVMRTEAAGAPRLVAERPRKWIDQLATGPNGAIAFASGRSTWALDGRGTAFELTRPRAVGGLAFLPKGFRVAIAGYNGVGLWFPGTVAPPQELEWKGAHIGVTVSPDGRSVVSSMQENALHGWRLADGQHMRMSGYPTKVRSMSWSVKGRFLVTSGAGVAIAWPFHFKDGPMGKRPLELGGRQELVTRVAAHPAEEIAVLGYEDGMILLVRLSDGEEVLLRRPGEGPISALGWSPDGLELAFGTEAGEAGVVDLSA
ncbi:WD40 repeat domain-containing protein [Methylobrevis albus]|uniref:WD40 repeat domain-containing protein n=1 Tax=Methylobrevis albus TaxID=2793297 RepID=A0A931MZJ9_9HYPH|nr:WD40 repeat domain-containing protein [Methylobrevis albus]MBH0239527.1 WD40 repeat domain-containing protein [Methylobrevis albus]